MLDLGIEPRPVHHARDQRPQQPAVATRPQGQVQPAPDRPRHRQTVRRRAAHTRARYRDAFYAPLISDWRNFETWQEDGARTATERANRIWKQLLADYTPPPLDEAKRAWMEDDVWQGLRRFVEDSFVVKDPVELFVVQNVVLDGLMYPLVYDTIIDDVLSSRGGTPVAMLTQFMTDWFAETKKWSDATVKIAAAESAENKQILTQWLTEWRDRAASALLPVARIALGERTDAVMADVVQQFNARMAKAGVAI